MLHFKIDKIMKIKKEEIMLALAAMFSLSSVPGCTIAKAADPEDSDAVFAYREIYLPESTGSNAHKLGLNSLDTDWGIWGHNLRNILPEEPSLSVYAEQDGTTYHSQFCFSSQKLFDYVEDYIDSKYDSDEHIRFAILPNDNGIVCLCSDCEEIGNTKRNASPAVFEFINKLSKRFPNHLFFTSYYRTTQGLPKDTLPQNVGVLVSAIDYPLSSAPTPKEQQFLDVLNTWKKKTGSIFVWDYINDFDDYLTPYPIFDVMQRRLKLYADNGVNSVFLNGSGTDYSTFSELKADMLAALTANPDIDWRPLLKEKAKEYYPTAGDVISDFIIAQEDFVKANGKELPLYDGVAKALQTYLPKDQFIAFHDSLLELRPQTSGKERKYLDRLLGALAMTRLELNRIDGITTDSKKYLDDLAYLQREDIVNYNEAGWVIDRFIRDYNILLNHYDNANKNNLLKGKKLEALTPLDPDYSNIGILTDGMLGIPSNYHDGNLIMSPEVYSRIAIPNDQHLKHLRVGLVLNPAYKIDLPEEISLFSGGKEIATVIPSYPADNSGHAFVDFDIPSSAQGSLVLTLIKKQDSKSMAIDEIEGW